VVLREKRRYTDGWAAARTKDQSHQAKKETPDGSLSKYAQPKHEKKGQENNSTGAKCERDSGWGELGRGQ